ncbi:hypothetical protein BRC81_02385 [Halobacteriales archaeon QS_1_68_20]|nr:MAG: hypothetical protein BRC81_02385 [Halobacteriales archaeon QS_1_68_20]
MTNGLGTGFFAITLLAVLAGLALLGVAATAVAAAFYRRSGRISTRIRYPFVALLVAVLGVAGFGILVLFDEAPTAAGLFAGIVALPFLLVAVYLDRTTALSNLDVAAATVVAWGPAFLLGVVVVFGANAGTVAAFDLAPAEARRLRVAWIASAAGGVAVVLGMVSIANQVVGLLDPGASTRERS